MPNNYQFLDAYGSVLTAASSVVGGAHQPIVQISSIVGGLPVTFSGSPSISGTVNVVQQGAWSTSMVGVASVSQAGVWNVGVSGSVAAFGSIATLQGTNPWITLVSGSVAAILSGGSSVIAVLQSPSIVGTYAEDSASATNDKGVFSLAIRNDTLSSVTSADFDYSGRAVGPVGEAIVANSPITKWISGTTSVMYGASVAVIAAQGSSVFTYITGIQMTNESATLSRVTFADGAGAASVRAFGIAPAIGGSNMIFPNPIKIRENQSFTASISGVSSIYITAEGFTSKT